MEKENIYVTIDSEEKRLRAIEIFRASEQEIFPNSVLLTKFSCDYNIAFNVDFNRWMKKTSTDSLKQITLDELELLLDPSVDLTSYVVKDVVLSIDELKTQAAALGFELVEKPYQPKVGDFGVFWDINERNGFLGCISGIQGEPYKFVRNNNTPYMNFRKLTESEKQKIQSAW
jgi:hypothetical protein